MTNVGMTRLLKKSAFFGVLAMLFCPSNGGCEFYQYVDEGGAVSFTDNPAKIPKKYKNKKKSRKDDEDSPNSSVMRVEIERNSVLVPVTLCYQGKEYKANLVLDTGAQVSTLSPALASKLNINPKDTDIAYTQGVGGGVHATGHVKLDYVLVGPNRKYKMDFVVIKAGQYDGLLGMNFLRELRYHIDFESSTIKWGD